jgi:hypothetical protein
MCRRIAYTYTQDTCRAGCVHDGHEPSFVHCSTHGSAECKRGWGKEPIKIRLDYCLWYFKNILLNPEYDDWEEFLESHTVLHNGEVVAAFPLLHNQIQVGVIDFFWVLLDAVVVKHRVVIEERLATMNLSDCIGLGLNGCQERWAIEFRRALADARRAFKEAKMEKRWHDQAGEIVAYYFRDHRFVLDDQGRKNI